MIVRNHRDLPPPVILVGMHRSGTSMLAGLLRECGLYVGRRLGPNVEAHCFRNWNDALLARAGATWEDPRPFLQRLHEPGFVQDCGRWAGERLSASFRREYLGAWGPVVLSGERFRHWGWKDPRTCLTLGIWRDLFPRAKWLHIYRHPLDVAVSLERREERRREHGQPPRWPACLDLDHNLQLWEDYVRLALGLRSQGDRYHEVRYEDLLGRPRAHMEAVLGFCGLQVPSSELDAVAAKVDGGRTQRWNGPRYQPWLDRLPTLPCARLLAYA